MSVLITVTRDVNLAIKENIICEPENNIYNVRSSLQNLHKKLFQPFFDETKLI